MEEIQDTLNQIACQLPTSSSDSGEESASEETSKLPVLEAFIKELNHLNLETAQRNPKLRKLSRKVQIELKKLTKSKTDWITARRGLIEVTNTAADSLSKANKLYNVGNCLLAGVQIATIYVVKLWTGDNIPLWAKALLTATSVADVIVYLHINQAKNKVYHNFKKAKKKDTQMFQTIHDWLIKMKELDEDIQNMFPSGAEQSIIDEMETNDRESKDILEIFIKALRDNYKKSADNTELLYSTWLHFTCKQADRSLRPVLDFEVDEYEEGDLKDNTQTIFLEAIKLATSHTHAIIATNAIRMYSMTADFLNGNKRKKVENIRKLADAYDKQLTRIEEIVDRLTENIKRRSITM